MPFRSKAQERWMWATHPTMAKEWESKTSPREREKLSNYAPKKKKKGPAKQETRG